jgi:hypothetical protein
LSWFERLRGLETHPECERAREAEQQAEQRRRQREAEAEHLRQEKEKEQQREQFFKHAMDLIERGEFRELPVPTEVVLQPEEKCYGQVRGCCRAQLYPTMVGRRARPIGSSEVRHDGIVRKERGDLFVTQRRVFFVGPVASFEISLKRVLECSVAGDVLYIAVSGRSSGVRFIVPDAQYIQLVAALIRKLALLSRIK